MIYDRYVAAWENLDVEDYLACCHEDYEMTFHSTRKVLTLADFDTDQLASWMVSSKSESKRLIYENDDILVEHKITLHKEGNRTATLMVHLKKDGLLWRTETGVTPLPPKK